MNRFREDEERCTMEYSCRTKTGTIHRYKPSDEETKVHIILGWDDHSNLDLHVKGPCEEICNSNPQGTRMFILLDQSVSFSTDKPIKDIYFMNNISDGNYEVTVHKSKESYTPFFVHIQTISNGIPDNPISYAYPGGFNSKDKIRVAKINIHRGVPYIELMESKINNQNFVSISQNNIY